MSSKIWTRIIALALFAPLAIPGQLAAQDKQDQRDKHHHYKLIDLGSTFGGAGSFFNPGSGNDFNAFTSVLEQQGDRGRICGYVRDRPLPALLLLV